MSYTPDNSSMRISSGRDSNYKSSDVGTRPKGDPKTSKDFKKVLAKTSDDDDEESQTAKEIIEESDGTEGLMVAMKEDDKKKGPMSLFDLTSGKTAVKTAPTDEHAAKAVESPTALYAKMTTGDTKKAGKETFFETSENVAPPSNEKDKFTTRFATEQTDLSYVNPLATANTQPSVNLNISTEKAVVPVSNIQEIINQMVAKVSEMKNTGSTDTVITLKNPPMFAGATIVVTAFDSAKNEFNISIENLTQAAKHLIDIQGNKDSLLLALEQKGYAVHILSATTLVENRPVDSLPQEEQAGRQRGDEREGKEQGRRGQGQA